MNKRTLKSILRKIPPLNWLNELKKRFDDKRLLHLRSQYINYLKIYIDNETSIISSNCFAGRIMQDLKLQYNSPTLGLYFMYPDYIEFLHDLKFYLTDAKIQFVEHSKYKIGDERRKNWKHWYPIGLLGGKVEIHFLHYYTEKEASEKWYRRASRVNFDKLLIIGMDQNLCTEKDMLDFDNLPYKDKVFFSSKEVKGNNIIYVNEFKNCDCVGDPYKKGHIFYKYLSIFLQKKYKNK